METRSGEVFVLGPDDLIPARLESLKTRADAANQDVLKGTGQQGEDESRAEFRGPAFGGRKSDQDDVA